MPQLYATRLAVTMLAWRGRLANRVQPGARAALRSSKPICECRVSNSPYGKFALTTTATGGLVTTPGWELDTRVRNVTVTPGSNGPTVIELPVIGVAWPNSGSPGSWYCSSFVVALSPPSGSNATVTRRSGSDVMVGCLEGYAQLALSGLGAGLDALRQQMGARFARGPRSTSPTTPSPTTPPA